MAKISLAPIVEDDISELLEDLLPEDRAEILALGVTPEWGVRNSVETSIESVAIRGDGRLGALFGISETAALGTPYPWLLGTSLMRQHPLWLLRLSRKTIARWQTMFPYMSNYVDARHVVAVAWLQWLGAKLTLEPQFGPFRRPFYKFEFGELPCA